MKSILIIEDDVSIRFSLQEVLEAEGHRVVLAENGQVGLDFLLSGSKCEIVLLDLSMPVMDGHTFLIKFRENFPGNGLPIIVMTAAGTSVIPKDHPQNLVLRKPMDIDKLMMVVEESLSR